MAFVTTDKVRIANLPCEDLVALGRAPYTNWIGRMQEQDNEIVEQSLAAVGMSDYADEQEEPPMPMEEVVLGQLIHENHDRLIWLFDMFADRAYYLEMIEAKFAEAVPDYSRGRVHLSDMRKVCQWFNLMVAAGMTDFTIEEPAEESEATEE